MVEKYEYNRFILQIPEYVNEEIELPECPKNTDYIYYRISRSGYEHLEKTAHDIWLFWFPYLVTTIIAALSLIAQIVK